MKKLLIILILILSIVSAASARDNTSVQNNIISANQSSGGTMVIISPSQQVVSTAKPVAIAKPSAITESPEEIASTSSALQVKDAKLYLIHGQQALEIKVLPVDVTENVKQIEPQSVETIELKVENNKPVYEIKSIEEMEIKDGTVTVEITSKADTGTGEITAVQKILKKNNELVEEKENELALIQNNELVKLGNISEKEVKREKLLVKHVKPLVSIEKIKSPVLSKKEKLILQTQKDCLIADKKLILSTDNYEIVSVETKDIDKLLAIKCVLKIADEEKKPQFIKYSKEVLKAETEEKIRKLELKKSIHDVIEMPKLKEYMAEDKWEIKAEQTSPYQQFITPDEIKDEVAGLSNTEIYEKAKSFVWVSDSVLHNKPEKWLLPHEFLTNTPEMELNPSHGEIASDCSEQANTLVSMLRASGVPAEDVRAVLGKVNFSGNAGGHAWVEIKQDGKWLVLEATTGPFYDEETGKKIARTGVGYDYWKYHEYPAIEVWAYYNDKYFTDKNEEVADKWSQTAETSLENDISGSFLRLNIFSRVINWFKAIF